MKTLITSVIILTAIITANAEGLNENAKFIKGHYPDGYAGIRKYAVAEWDTNYEMIIYTINNQADAVFKVASIFQTSNTEVLFNAIKEWSLEGFEAGNVTKFKSLKSVTVPNLLTMHCNWEMVEYTYTNQVKAKNSF